MISYLKLEPVVHMAVRSGAELAPDEDNKCSGGEKRTNQASKPKINSSQNSKFKIQNSKHEKKTSRINIPPFA